MLAMSYLNCKGFHLHMGNSYSINPNMIFCLVRYFDVSVLIDIFSFTHSTATIIIIAVHKTTLAAVVKLKLIDNSTAFLMNCFLAVPSEIDAFR